MSRPRNLARTRLRQVSHHRHTVIAMSRLRPNLIEHEGYRKSAATPTSMNPLKRLVGYHFSRQRVVASSREPILALTCSRYYGLQPGGARLKLVLARTRSLVFASSRSRVHSFSRCRDDTHRLHGETHLRKSPDPTSILLNPHLVNHLDGQNQVLRGVLGGY